MAQLTDALRLARLFLRELRAGDGDAVRKHDVIVHSVTARLHGDWFAFCACVTTGEPVYLDIHGLRASGGVHIGPMFLPCATDISKPPVAGDVFYGLFIPPTAPGRRATLTDAVPAQALEAFTSLMSIPATTYNSASELAHFRARGAQDDTFFVCSRALRGDFAHDNGNDVLRLPMPMWQVMIALAVFLGDAQIYTRYYTNTHVRAGFPSAPRSLPTCVVSALVRRLKRVNALVKVRDSSGCNMTR